jgi:hypothetical protein
MNTESKIPRSKTSKSDLAKELAEKELAAQEAKLKKEVEEFQKNKPKVVAHYSPARLPRDEYHLRTPDLNSVAKSIYRKPVHSLFIK